MASNTDRPRPADLELNSSNYEPYSQQGHDVAEGSSLPRGAGMPQPQPYYNGPIDYQPVSTRTPNSAPAGRDPSPESSDNHVQFAKYPPEKAHAQPWNPPVQHYNSPGPGRVNVAGFVPWTPFQLRPEFWIPYFIVLVLGAIGLEVALYYSNKHRGWPIKNDFTATQGIMHYVYTFPTVVVAMLITSVWAFTDIEFKRMQPYIDLVHGDAPPAKSLLLDYTRENNFIVWQTAARNRHYIITLSSLMVILTLCVSPLSASLFSVRDTKFIDPPTTITSTGVVGLNQGDSFQDLTAFVNAAGFASAAVLYDLNDPEFIYEGWAVAPFELPDIKTGYNGTVYANTSAVLSDPGCQPPDLHSVNMDKITRTINGVPTEGWNNSASFRGCTFSWWVDKRAKNLFGFEALGEDTSQCDLLNAPEEFRAVAFWFFTYETNPPKTSIAFCQPNISLWNVNVEIDAVTGGVVSLTQLDPLTSSSPNSDALGNITGAPLEGRAYNGVAFDLEDSMKADPFVLGRANATQLQLPAAIFNAASESKQGRIGSFENDAFVGLSTGVYRTYLALVAQKVYFLPVRRSISGEIESVRKRLWMSDVAAHLLAAAMIILAFFGTIAHLLHRADRRDLNIGLPPGTIASAVSVGGQTSVGAALSGRQRPEEVEQVLHDKKFRIDPDTMKIVMAGEEGYDNALSAADPRRQSVFGKLQMGMQPSSPQPASRRFSRMAASAPTSPHVLNTEPPRSAV